MFIYKIEERNMKQRAEGVRGGGGGGGQQKSRDLCLKGLAEKDKCISLSSNPFRILLSKRQEYTSK